MTFRCYYGVVHSAISLNAKVRELLRAGISNHNASSKSHVRFIMKMLRKKDPSNKTSELETKHKALESSYNNLKKDMDSAKGKIKSLESLIQKISNEMKAHKKEIAATKS